jgi:O-acetyl-ADP-ribose deacetylase (regulator of RNase III)
MEWLFVYHSDENLGEQWRRYFAGQPGVQVLQSDICHVKADAVVSPANSFGFMDGGLDRALSERFGWVVQESLQRAIAERPMRELLVGEAIILPTGDMEVPWLISAPTMRVPMRLRQSVNAFLAMKAIFHTAISHKGQPPIHSVAIPGLGTGVGGLKAETAALQMWTAYREVILKDWLYPDDFGEAQKAHLHLNVDEIMIWD